ncbi:aldo/keto reductase [Paenibacillus sp. 1P07SE]|uniref:aldo/keto reductase n=1 Tax=Paenibacillus sp. 1P07SE TaxID=3132209 RepID=UPI0039A6D1F4
MQYTVLGKTGLRVSVMGLGGAPLSDDFGRREEAEVTRVVHEAIDCGINLMDTAPQYGLGVSEERIGRALAGGKRKKVVLATKAALAAQPYEYKTIIQSAEQSLGRLRTDWVDLLQLHDVEKQPYELLVKEAIPALCRLREDGKIRYLGVTSRDLDLLVRLVETNVFDTVQFYGRYILMDQSAEERLLPAAAAADVGVIQGSVLAMGLLADSPAPFLEEDTLEKARIAVDQLAFLRQPGPAGLVEPAMRFSLSHPPIHVTLTGAASSEQLRQNAALCDGKGIGEEAEAQVRRLFKGHSIFA